MSMTRNEDVQEREPEARKLRREMFSDQMLDELMARNDERGVALTGGGGFLAEMVKAVLERGMDTELRGKNRCPGLSPLRVTGISSGKGPAGPVRRAWRKIRPCLTRWLGSAPLLSRRSGPGSKEGRCWPRSPSRRRRLQGAGGRFAAIGAVGPRTPLER